MLDDRLNHTSGRILHWGPGGHRFHGHIVLPTNQSRLDRNQQCRTKPHMDEYVAVNSHDPGSFRRSSMIQIARVSDAGPISQESKARFQTRTMLIRLFHDNAGRVLVS